MRWMSAGGTAEGAREAPAAASAGYGGLQPYLSSVPWQLSALSSPLWTACQALEMEMNCT